ncbi:hypothetical protein NKJ81_29165 [Mesorhizobium sp. M0018]|uniref:hypothetical protein n=1 Tax=Mesorhizobium sp. M0018 TaxID=2956844 RepID=UPI00333741D9
MPIKKIGLLALIACAFSVWFLVIIVKRGTDLDARPLSQSAVLEPFAGQLAIRSIDDLRVAGRKIVLCGVAVTKPQSIRAMVTEAARRDYQGLALTCKPVGAGTPCDGNIAAKFGDALVVQCLTSDGTDLAAKLVEAGILCGQPAQAGSTYKSCAPGS